MIKYFCDSCGSEIKENQYGVDNPLPFLFHVKHEKIKKVNAAVVIYKAKDYYDRDISNQPHFCKYCLIDAVNTLDDRPRCGGN